MKETIATLISGLIIAGAIYTADINVTAPVNVHVPEQKTPIVNVSTPEPKENPVFRPTLGAVSTLDGVDNPYVTINGVRTAYRSVGMAATSSTICSIPNPYATTTLVVRLSARATANGIGGSQTLSVATSSDAFLLATGPAFLKAVPLASTPWSVAWDGPATTTHASYVWGNDGFAGQAHTVLRAGERLNFQVATGTPGTFTSYYTGYCRATFQEI